MRKANTLAALLGASLMAACVSSPPPVPQKPGQAWYAATAAYTVAAETAAIYRTECGRRPPILQRECRKVVRDLIQIDTEAEEIQEYGDLAAVTNDEDMLKEATERLDEIKYRLQRRIAEQMEKEGTAR